MPNYDDSADREAFVIPPETKVLDSNNKPCLYKELKENEIPKGIWACEMDGKQVYISVFNLGDHKEGSQYITWKELNSTQLEDGWKIPSREFFDAFFPIYPDVAEILWKIDKRLPRYFEMWTNTPYKEDSYWVLSTNLCGYTTPSDTTFSTHVGKAIFEI